LRTHGAENVKWIWSPAGNEGAEAYYPGDDVVDVVGTTVLYDQHFYGDLTPSFSDLAQKRSWLNKFGKPVWIVEFGAGNSNPAYQKQMTSEAITQFLQLGFSALIYLNIADSNIIGPNYAFNNSGDLIKILGLKLQPSSPITETKPPQNSIQNVDMVKSILEPETYTPKTQLLKGSN
jgi:beta-mannanase